MGGGGREKERLFLVMPEIFHQILWRQGSQVVRIWWSWEQALHPATHWIVLKWFPEFNPLAVLCTQTAACLLPVGIFTPRVYLQCLGPDCSYLSRDEPCRERLVNFKSVSTRASSNRIICHLIDYNETLPV